MSTAFQKAVRKYGKGRKTSETRPEYKEDSTGSRSYDLVAQFHRFPLSKEDDVEQWANEWFDWKACRKRVELRGGKHLRKIWKNGVPSRELIEKALRGETLFTETELLGAGATFLTLLSHFHWQELAAIADATKATVESTRLDAGPEADIKVVTLNSFEDLSRSGKLPTKAEVKEAVRKKMKFKDRDDCFSKVFEAVGLTGLPEGKRGRKRSPKKVKRS